MGRIWGTNMQTAAEVAQVLTNPHSPARYRVMGTLSNLPEFAKAFSCPVGAKVSAVLGGRVTGLIRRLHR